MAASDKNILISPQRGSATQSPSIRFTGDGNDPISIYALDGVPGSLSIEGSAGQLFSLTNNLTSGSIFSVNDVSGLPSIDVNASGLVQIAPFSGTLAIGKSTVTSGQTVDIKGNVRIDGNLTIPTNSVDLRAPIFYDSNDTGYYLDPNATSNLSLVQTKDLRALGQIRATGWYGTNSSSHTGPAIEIGVSSPGSTNGYIIAYNRDSGSYLNMNFNATAFTFGGQSGGFLTCDTSIRAPIFYDTANTAYYTDPASTSNLRGLTVFQIISGSISGNAATATNLLAERTNWSTYGTITAVVGQLAWKQYGNNHTIFDASQGTSPEGGAVNNTNSAVAWSATYPTLMGWNGSTTHGVRVDSARISDSTSGSAGSVNFNNLTNKTGGTGTYTTSGDFRAPIFYDSNDTTYYLDPTSTGTSLKLAGNLDLYARSASWSEGIRVRMPTRSSWAGIRFTRDEANDNGNWAIGYTGIDATDDLTFYGNLSGSSGMKARMDLSAHFTVYGSVRAPIFYDSQDTNYYLNLNNFSRLDRLVLNQSRIDSSRFPVGHYASGDTVFEIDPSWTGDQLQAYFNQPVNWVDDSTAPGGYAIQVMGPVNVGGAYGSGFPYIPVDQDDVFYMEVWIKTVAGTNTHYMGSIDFNSGFGSLGGNPGSFGYWVMSGSNPGNTWTKYSGYITGFGSSTGQFVSGTKYFTPLALFNYSGGGTSYISGWKCIRTTHQGNRTIVGRSGSITDNSNYALDIFHPTSYRQLKVRSSSHPLIKLSGDYNGGNGAEIWQNSSGTLIFNVNGSQSGVYVNPGPYTELLGSARSPIFYDSGNTAYYTDPASTSNLNGLTVAATITGSVSGTAASETLATVSGRGSTTSTLIRINNQLQVGQNTNGTAWIDAYGGFAYYGSDSNSTGMKINNAGTAQFYLDARAPIFYDSNNTGYYTDPASNSILNTGTFNGRMKYSNYLVSNNSGGLMGDYDINGTASKVIWTIGESWPIGNMYGLAYEYGSGYDHHLAIRNNGTTYSRFGFAGGAFVGGTVTAGGDMRAPIFYDSGNTAYYTDPASTSNLNGLTVAGTITGSVSGNSGTVGGLSVHTGRNNEANKVVRTDGNGYIQAGWINTTSGNLGVETRLDRVYCSNDAYVRYLGLTDFKNQMGLSSKNNYSRRVDYTSDANYWVGSFGHVGYGANETFHGGSGFWDIWGGTNYPGGLTHIHGFNALHYTTSSLGTTGGAAYGWQMAAQYNTNNGPWWRRCSAGSFSGWLRLVSYDSNNSGDIYANTFYDSGNTAYYTDPLSTSVLNALTLGGRATTYAMYYQGFTLDANTMDTNSAGFTYSVNAPYTGPVVRFSTGGGYDLWLNSPYGGNGYGLAFRTRNGDSGSINSWQYPAVYGVNVNGGGALYSTIYYDQNNTGYYVDPNGDSNLNTTLTIGSTLRVNNAWTYVANNYGYGIVGLYASTVFQLVFAMGDAYKTTAGGGINNLYGIAWSHPNAGGIAGNLNTHGALITENGTFLAALSGSIRCRDDMRAPIFYDSNNTGYYTDPLSTSVLNNVQVTTFGVGTAASGTTGEIRATNNVTAYYSDERLKENIKTIPGALSKVLTLKGVTFNSNKLAEQYGYTDKKEQVGVIAQDVEKVLPQVVVPAPFDIAKDVDGNEYSKSGENYKTVHYDKLVPLLIEAIKDQQKMIEELRKEVDNLKKLV